MDDKNTRGIDKATHQIVQKGLPEMAQWCYEAAHTSSVVIFAQEYINGYKYVVENRFGYGTPVKRGFFWHSTFGTGAITASGFMLHPNIQERKFARNSPMLDSLDPANVFQYYRDLC